MGGHGGLNILPQKRWNVYNQDNREKVRRDEEAAAREEYIKQQQALKTEAESRLEKLRTSKRKHDSAFPPQHEPSSSNKEEDGCAVNLDALDTWETLVGKSEKASDVAEWKVDKEIKREATRTQKMKKKDEETRAMMPGDETSRLGYGLVGKDVKKPWYLSKTDYKNTQPEEDRRDDKKSPKGEKSHKKKSLQELREERLKREQQEREKAKKLLLSNGSLNQGTSKSKYSADGHRHIPYYNSGYGHARC